MNEELGWDMMIALQRPSGSRADRLESGDASIPSVVG